MLTVASTRFDLKTKTNFSSARLPIKSQSRINSSVYQYKSMINSCIYHKKVSFFKENQYISNVYSELIAISLILKNKKNFEKSVQMSFFVTCVLGIYIFKN